jgi:putative transposase
LDPATWNKRRPGRKALLTAEHGVVLTSIAQELPRSPLDELTREFNRRCCLNVCAATVRKALKQAGIERMRPMRRAVERAAVPGGAPARVGYAQQHQREDSTSGMSTDLTDAEWALVADLFEHHRGGRGAPPTHERRVLVNACCYVVRTGCAWRLLPGTFPPWQAVYKAFSRWAVAGVFETMHDRLRQQWRDRIGKTPVPTAAILEAQCTRSTTRAGNTGLDAGTKV